VTPASRQQCSRLQQSRWRRYNFCCDVRSSNLQYFSMCRTTPKPCLFTLRSGLFLGPNPVTPNGISIGSAVICMAHKRDQQTDRQTHRPRYSICRNRLLCVRCDLVTARSQHSQECKNTRCFWWLVTVNFDLLTPKHPGLMVDHFYVKFGDPLSCR